MEELKFFLWRALCSSRWYVWLRSQWYHLRG